MEINKIGKLKPILKEKGLGAYNGIVWTCDNCDFKTELTFVSKDCPKCKIRVRDNLYELIHRMQDRVLLQTCKSRR